jgi:hypothetical protein
VLSLSQERMRGNGGRKRHKVGFQKNIMQLNQCFILLFVSPRRHQRLVTSMTVWKICRCPCILIYLQVMDADEIRSKYSYLWEKSVSLHGLLWEFIRRSEDYGKTYSELSERLDSVKFKAEAVFFSNSEMEYKCSDDVVNNKLETLEREYGIKPNPHITSGSKGYLIKEILGSPYQIGIPNPNARYHKDDIFPLPLIKTEPLAVTLFRKEKAEKLSSSSLHKYCHTLIEKISITDKDKMLYIGIAKNADPNDLLHSFKEVLKKYDVKKESAERYDKSKNWRLYIIYYDLYKPLREKIFKKKEEGKAFYKPAMKVIAWKVRKAFPEHTPKWNYEKEEDWWKYVNNGYDEAIKLIDNKGFIDYLYL